MISNDFKLKLNRSRCFQCLNSSMIIPLSRVCDGLVDCPDLSDECLCEENYPSICDHIRMRHQISEEQLGYTSSLTH